MPNVYYANDEFRCPGEVICRELENLTGNHNFLWRVYTTSGCVVAGWRNTAKRRFSFAEFLRWLDAFAAEDAYEKGCSCCGTDLTSSNLAWADGEPICIVCASLINAVPWTSSVQDLLH